MKCPICGDAELVTDTRDVEYEYKGQKTTLKTVSGDFCDACGEIIMDARQGEYYMKQVAAFKRRVNSQIVDPAFITRVRKQLNLDQRQAAEIFGGGINAFSRYETGRVVPPVPLVMLFKMLEKHPERFDEIK